MKIALKGNSRKLTVRLQIAGKTKADAKWSTVDGPPLHTIRLTIAAGVLEADRRKVLRLVTMEATAEFLQSKSKRISVGLNGAIGVKLNRREPASSL